MDDVVVQLTQQDVAFIVNRLTMAILVASFLGAVGALLLWDATRELLRAFSRRERREEGRDVRP